MNLSSLEQSELREANFCEIRDGWEGREREDVISKKKKNPKTHLCNQSIRNWKQKNSILEKGKRERDGWIINLKATYKVSDPILVSQINSEFFCAWKIRVLSKF